MNELNDIDLARRALAVLPASVSDDRDAWLKAGMAARSISEDLFPDWEAFSARSEKLKPTICRQTWQSFKRDGIGAGTLFDLADKHAPGWRENGHGGPKMRGGRNGGQCQRVIDRKAAGEIRTHWKSQAQADAEYENLPRVIDDPDRRRFFADDYSLSADEIPDGWRIFNHPKHGPGVVYQVFSADRRACYHFRSFKRDDRNKRLACWLWGNEGAAFYNREDGQSLTVTHGAEKGAIAFAAGFNVLAFSSGETALSDSCLQRILEIDPPKVIFADDADDQGRKANEGSANALEAAGFAPDKIALIAWPADAPAGYDLNDIAKAGGLDAVRALIESAPQIKPSLPRVLSLGDFLAAQRPPLAWHIKDILPYGGKMTFSATSKFGKSMWAIQTGLALAAGYCSWLGWEFGPPVRVLYLQAEISDALLEKRLDALQRTMPAVIDMVRASQNFFIQETTEGAPNLADENGRRKTEAIIARERPDVIFLDPLAACWPGLEENAAETMGAALGYLSDLGRQSGAAIILVHHHGKAGVSRGSSAFEAWPESDLSATYANEERTIAKVEMRLRCAFNHGPLFWKMPSEDNLWFEVTEAPEGTGKRRSKATGNHVLLVLKAAGGSATWGDLRDGIRQACDCGERTAATAITEAKSAGLVEVVSRLYRLPMAQTMNCNANLAIERAGK